MQIYFLITLILSILGTILSDKYPVLAFILAATGLIGALVGITILL